MLQSDIKARAEFQPVRAAGDRQWRVQATFPSGKTIEIGAFDGEQAAREWIALKSAEWLALFRCPRNLPHAGL
jgi:hypothetical protein